LFSIFAKKPFLMIHQTIISFDNTEAAFYSRSDKDLTKAYRLFSVINNKFIAKAGIFLIKILASLHLPIFYFVKKTLFKQFCGGESLDDCRQTIAALHKFNIGSILDYAVEGGENEARFDAACDEIIRAIQMARGNPAIPFAVFKPSGIASKKLLFKASAQPPLNETDKALFLNFQRRFKRICESAYLNGVRLFIDSEESWLQEATDRLAYEMMRHYNRREAIVFNTFQMYRKDMPQNLRNALRDAAKEGYFLGAKLVRGAYMEKERKRAARLGYEDPIFPEKKMTDEAFNEGLRLCIDHISTASLCCGSHNEESALFLTRLMNERGIARDHPGIYFAQLYGMSDHISYNLALAGYNAVKYVPYGPVKAVIPYLIRRAEENTAIAGQTSRELTLIRKEMKRRKLEAQDKITKKGGKVKNA